MSQVICEVYLGLGERDASVAVHDVQNVRTFLHVDRDFLASERGRAYLPVGVVRRDPDKGVALIELPQEADSGAHRLWVPLSPLREVNGMPV